MKIFMTNLIKVREDYIYMYIYIYIFIYLKIFYLFFLERGEGRERNISVWLTPSASHWGPGLQLRHVPQMGIEPATLLFTPNPLSHTSKGYLYIYLHTHTHTHSHNFRKEKELFPQMWE